MSAPRMTEEQARGLLGRALEVGDAYAHPAGLSRREADDLKQWVTEQAAEIERLKGENERCAATLAAIQRKAENWGHGEDCLWGNNDEPEEDDCSCGKAEVLAILCPKDGSLPGAAFLAHRDALRSRIDSLQEEHAKALVRARNEGLERAAARLDGLKDVYLEFGDQVAASRVRAAQLAHDFRAMKEAEQ